MLPDITDEWLVKLVKEHWDRTQQGNELTSLLLKRSDQCLKRSRELLKSAAPIVSQSYVSSDKAPPRGEASPAEFLSPQEPT